MGVKVITKQNSEPPTHRLQLLPRLIRHRDAAAYLGMERHKFDNIVRPHLTEILMSRQTLCFDRLELDAWVDQLKQTLNPTVDSVEVVYPSSTSRQNKRRIKNTRSLPGNKTTVEKKFEQVINRITRT